MRLIFSIFLVALLHSCAATLPKLSKINGVSYVASREAIDSTHVQPVLSVNANYAAIMPFGFIKDLESPEIIFNTDRQWFGERYDGAKQYIESLQAVGIQIMIKPQIWVWRGEFTGHIKMKDEASWKTLEATYSKFILEYARLANETQADIFCIGTELEQFVRHRPQYWKQLIQEIKTLYKGKLTYAANWDEFKRTPFWNDLDFIGVDAYFPISDAQTPTIEEARQGWLPHKSVLKDYADRFSKPILFTEYGYRSMDYAGKEPWVSDHTLPSINMEAQTHLTQALYDTFWNESWFAGGFIWKWFHKHEQVGGLENNRFTPQNKPVQNIIKKTYGAY